MSMDFDKLRTYGIASREDFISEAFSRNIGLFTAAEQQKLADATVAIPGMGGVGGVHLITLVRTGIGRLHLADFDTFEPANINRQFGASVPELGRSKLAVMREKALSINPFLTIQEFPEGVSEANVDRFLDNVDVVLDGLDFFQFDLRRLLFKKARERGIFVITAGPMGFSSAMLVFSPFGGMSFDDYFDILDGMKPREKYLAFALGLTPRPTHIRYMDLSRVSLDSRAGPSLDIACQICAGMAATEAIRILLGKKGVKPVPYYFQFDPFSQTYRKGRLRCGNRNPIQRLRTRVVVQLLESNRKRYYKPTAPARPKILDKNGNPSQEALSYILSAGIRAPSGDNCQPWKLSCSGNRIDLFLDPEADRSFFNVDQIASLIACGAAVENMQIAADGLGFFSRIRWMPSDRQTHLAAIELTAGNQAANPLTQAVWQRQTNRKPFSKKPLTVSEMKAMHEAIDSITGARLHLITETFTLKKLAKLVFKADRIRTENRLLHEHLTRMIRFTPQEAETKRDGFFLKNLEAGHIGDLFLKLTRSWTAMEMANRLGLGRLVAAHAYQGLLNSAGAGLITVEGTEVKSFLDGGRALERLWLTLTQKDLAFQPMTAITLFWLRCQREGNHAFSATHRRLLDRVWKGWRQLFPEIHWESQNPVMLFRFGQANPIQFGTYRKDVSAFLVDRES